MRSSEAWKQLHGALFCKCFPVNFVKLSETCQMTGFESGQLKCSLFHINGPFLYPMKTS